jgi:phage protein
MSFKGFIKSKTLGEYLQAKKDPRLMEEIENRGIKTVLKESAKASGNLVEVGKQKKIEKNAIKCPHCSSKKVQFMQQNKKGFSVGKAVGGAVLTGGIGTLAGFAGKKGKKQWHCQECGNIFETK